MPPADDAAASVPSADPANPTGGQDNRPGAGVVVRLAQSEWIGSHFQTAIYQRLLLELGYSVLIEDDAAYPAGIAFSKLAEDAIDIWPHGLFPIHDGLLPDASVVIPIGLQTPGASMEGIMVNRQWALANDVAYLDDIAERPNLITDLDIDGDGSADIFGCSAGTTCQALIDRLIDNDGWPFTQISTPATDSLLGDVVVRITANEPTLIYAWTPSDRVNALTPGDQMVWLSVRNPVAGWATDANLDAANCPARPCNTGFVSSDGRAVARTDFLAENPVARTLTESIQISAADVSRQNERILTLLGPDGQITDEATRDIRAAIDLDASTWITTNRSVVNTWIEAAIAAG